MKNAVLVASGIGIGLLGALLTLARADATPRAHAQTVADNAGGSTLIMGTGGGTANQNDICWVLSKVKPAKGPDRTVLALYRAVKNGSQFELEDVRAIDADLRVIELQKHQRTVAEMLQGLPKEEQDALRPPAPAKPPGGR